MVSLFKSANTIAAMMAGQSGVIEEAAVRVEATMRSVAAGSSVGAEYVEGIGIERAGRGKDRIVGTNAPLAVPIELGHIVRNEADGPALAYVRGAHVISKTVARLPEVRGD